MKEMNRREFLTLTGAAVVALSLAGCGGPSAPPAPPAVPTGKEAKVLEAINLFRREKGWGDLKLDSILNNAADLFASLASGEIDDDTLYETIIRLDSTRGGEYVNITLPETTDPQPSYSDDVATMKNELLAYNLTNIGSDKLTLVGIKVVTAEDGSGYWFAVTAERKK